MLRHDLFDVDRLLGQSLAWGLTTVGSAAIFAAAVATSSQVFGRGSAAGATGAAFVTALCLLPLHRLLQLHGALDDVRASRARLVAAGDRERAALERDLHDGAQQQIVTVGMRLRSVQHQLDSTNAVYGELDDAVAALETTLTELRRLAHGVRPARLEDGLAPALRALVTGSPVPVELTVPDVVLPDPILTTAYYVVAEALANACKHAAATQVSVLVERTAEQVRVRVHDDGCGGARDGFGLTSLRDRVAAVGGTFCVRSPVGAGTDVEVGLPCAL